MSETTTNTSKRMSTKRPLTLTERYLVSCDNVGHRSVVSYVVSYTPEALPTVDELHARVDVAQARLPLLHAVIEGAYTRTPATVVRDSWPAADIVHTCPDALDAMGALKAELAAFRKYTSQQPGWRVAVYPTTGHLALSINHVFIDGRGSLRLLEALTVARDDPKSAYNLVPEDGTHASYDDTVLQRLSFPLFVKMLWGEIAVPLLPRWIQEWLAKGSWPGACESPFGHAWEIVLAEVDKDTLGRLSAAGKDKGVPTLHPLILAAYHAAAYAVFHDRDPGGDDDGDRNKPFIVTCDSPRSDRQPKLGHSAVTGVYTTLQQLERTLRGSDDIWSLARSLNQEIASPASIAAARQMMSALRFLPDPDPKPSPDGHAVTGWMAYLNERAQTSAPFFDSLMVSNLGRFVLPEGATDCIWSQVNHPSGYCLGASVLGHERGLRVTTQFYDGLPEKARIEEMHARFVRIVGRMADGAEGSVAQLAGDTE